MNKLLTILYAVLILCGLSAGLYGYFHNLYLVAVAQSFSFGTLGRGFGIIFPPLGALLGFI